MAITGGGYPPAPNLTFAERNNANGRGWGGGWPACQTDKLVTVTLANGVRITMRREVAEMTRLILNECLRRGYAIRSADTGGFNCRAIASTVIPSNHSWGLAVDVNWQTNVMGETQASRVDIPPWMVVLFWSFGFFWGGWYGRPDAMHFEYVRTPAQAALATVRARDLGKPISTGDGEMDVRQSAQLFNASSIAGRMASMRDTAPIQDMHGNPAGELPLDIVTAVKGIQESQESQANDLATLSGQMGEALTLLRALSAPPTPSV